MKSLTLNVKSPNFQIVLAGDSHDGSVLTHVAGIHKLIDYVHGGKNIYWAHMGDWIEAITTDDKRYDHDSSLDPIPLKQAHAVVKMFEPIRKKCFCGLIGNHELKLHRFGNLVQDVICKELNIPYGTYTAIVRVEYRGKFLFEMFLWHGPARGTINSNAKDYEQRIANMKASLKMKFKYKWSSAAIMACGHVHKLLIVPPSDQLYLHSGDDQGIHQDYLTGLQEGQFIDSDRRWYLCCGSFLKLFENNVIGYAEMSGYDPVELGFPIITVEGGKIVSVEPYVV